MLKEEFKVYEEELQNKEAENENKGRVLERML